jgi:diadenosine tetraphosphate (Ap4A) HIT family hydrolase
MALKFELDFLDHSDKERAHLPHVIFTTRQMIDSRYQPQGNNMGMNCGQAAGQTIVHFHCHIIPRYNGDTPNPRGGIRQCIPRKGDY